MAASSNLTASRARQVSSGARWSIAWLSRIGREHLDRLAVSRAVSHPSSDKHSFAPLRWLVMAGLVVFATAATADSRQDSYPAASRAPRPASGWEKLHLQKERTAPPDEAQGGFTLRGTPIRKRDQASFPTDPRHLFGEVDMRRGPDGTLRSIFTDGSPISPQAREAIRGQNIWILWSEGNEAFWGWLQERNYGITDFLILIDSRKRERRFHEAGLINQPGMRARTDRTILGLYLDQADGDHVTLRQPDNDIDAGTNARASRPERGTATATPIFKPYDSRAYEETLRQLATDGVDPEVYGYPTGIVGLRLFPNPDFFADTPAAARARAYWQERVESRSNDRDNNYYANPAVASDPDLVRPFRISMTCAFCHIGPHPLNPPADPEKPEWANLSSTIGAQYWTGSRAFSNLKDQKSNLKDRKSFLFQLVQSWQPGTLDTSLVSTDQINNPNTMNAIFGIPARLARAQHNPPEAQSASNLLIPAVEDTEPFANPRHTPRVLLDGSDSIGIAGALARVYLNIGAYYEQWIRLHNPLIGFRPQRPFELATIEDKSAYWRATQQQRISDLVAFFTYVNKAGETVTAPMKLAGAPGGKEAIAREAADAVKGRTVFVENCAICHSSKQPEGFALTFSRNWAGAEPPDPGEPARFVLPMDFAEWEAFKRSDAYDEYRKRIVALAGTALAESDPFLENNYLSTDIRVPVTLVGTNSSRAVATNAMRGQIWDNFSSDTYKNLPAVGAVHFYNPYSGVPTDEWGNNDVYFPPRGGPGYYRPASLISIWATAPFLHNNALGRYTHDPSVQGRLAAFDDAIDKLLWKAKRFPSATDPPGDLRFREKAFAGRDPGFIYRTTDPSSIDIPPKFIRILLVGVMGERWTSFLTRYLWLGLGAIAIIFIVFGRQQDAGFVLLLFAVLVGALLRVTRVDAVYPVLWWAPAIALAVALALWLAPRRKAVAQLFFAVFAAFFFVVAALASDWADGRRGALDIAIPKGTPVNLLMSLNPQAPTRDLVDALSGLTRGLLRVHKERLPDGDPRALRAFEAEAGLPLLKASKCPDFVLDRGHWFAEGLSDDEKVQLKAFLKTL